MQWDWGLLQLANCTISQILCLLFSVFRDDHLLPSKTTEYCGTKMTLDKQHRLCGVTGEQAMLNLPVCFENKISKGKERYSE